MTFKKAMLLLCIITLLLIAPVSAKEITTTVDDKEIINNYDSCYTVHTIDFGDIQVTDTQYQQIFINDTITFNTESDFGLYTVSKINGENCTGMR